MGWYGGFAGPDPDYGRLIAKLETWGAGNTNLNWLQASPSTGQISGRFRMTVNPADLAPGDYTGKVRLKRPEGAGGPEPVEIPVNLEVQPGGPPRLRISGSSATLKPGEVRTYTVTNTGGDTARGTC